MATCRNVWKSRCVRAQVQIIKHPLQIKIRCGNTSDNQDTENKPLKCLPESISELDEKYHGAQEIMKRKISWNANMLPCWRNTLLARSPGCKKILEDRRISHERHSPTNHLNFIPKIIRNIFEQIIGNTTNFAFRDPMFVSICYKCHALASCFLQPGFRNLRMASQRAVLDVRMEQKDGIIGVRCRVNKFRVVNFRFYVVSKEMAN